MNQEILAIIEQYGDLQRTVDQWFNHCQTVLPEQIRCGQGCSGCCRSLFDITLLDAWYLQVGYYALSPLLREQIMARAARRLEKLRRHWPELAAPFVLNYRPEADWEQLMPEEDETPCVFLGADGRCLVYDHRPMTCRLHGLPLVDSSGEVLYDEWCTENFPDQDPLALQQLRAPFARIFQGEVTLMRKLTALLFEQRLNELDTLIPLAVLEDYGRFDWRRWRQQVLLVKNAPVR